MNKRWLHGLAPGLLLVGSLVVYILVQQNEPSNVVDADPDREASEEEKANDSNEAKNPDRFAEARAAAQREKSPMPEVAVRRSPVAAAAVARQNPANPHFLTGPQDGEPLDITLDFVRDPANTPDFEEADFVNPAVSSQFQSRHNGVTHLHLKQRLGGIEVYNGLLSANLLPDGSIINLHNGFVPDLASQVNRIDPLLTAEEAIRRAAGHFELEPTAPLQQLQVDNPNEDAQEQLFTNGGISLQSIPAKLNFVALENDTTRLAWNTVIYFHDRQRVLDLNVDAENGELLSSANWVSTAMYNVYPPPTETPSHGGRQTETDPHDTTASPFGWHDTNGVAGAEFTDTRGNNVNAQEDADNNNTGGLRPSGGVPLDFDFPIDLGQAPSTYQSAVTTNLFYWNNIIHDMLYHYGFDEPAGNFQQNNYGKGGTGGDPVEADSQDGSGTNNANFLTPPDGTSGRMQMYIWTGPNPDRDSSFDNGIIIHEYGHGVSNRLTGGPANSSALSANQSRGMGEGWSDWLGLALTHQPTDTATTGRGIGTYVLGQPTTGAGIRPYRYSTDIIANPQTFGDLAGGELSVPHGIGSVWCTTLWEVYWALIAEHGYDPDLYGGTGGNNIAIQLVLDGMKLQPATPTYTQARDAIILADQVNNGGANFVLLWAAFAKRGLGASAFDGGSASSLAVVEAFDIPDDLDITPPAQNIFTSGGEPGGPFTPSSNTYTLQNTGDSNLNWTATTTANWLDFSVAAGALTPGSGTNVQVSINANANTLPAGVHQATIDFNNTTSGATIARSVILSINDLSEAVDEPLLTFTSGIPTWFTQNVVTRDGVDAAQAGSITHSQNSYMELTLTGPEFVSFHWKVSSESSFDYLRFLDNGAQQLQISGEVDWTQVNYNVPAGTHTLRWEYSKDGSVDTGSDTGWVDEMYVSSVHPEPLITSSLSALGADGESFSYQITATKNPTSYASGALPSGLSLNTSTGLISGTPTTPGVFPVPITATNAEGSDTRTLTIRISGTASYPFTETFESGSLQNVWAATGTGPARTIVTQDNTPNSGSWHLTMDSSTSGEDARNELTLTINLSGQSNVGLSFWAKEFSDEANGPPTTPFIGGADFDGVAISEDGNSWYEVQPLRTEMTSFYSKFVVDLDAAIAAHGLAYNSGFRIRFNHFDNFPITTDGFAFDDIEVAPTAPEIVVEQPAGTDLTDGVSAIDYGTVGIGVQTTKSFTIRNVGTQSLTGLAASFTGAAAGDFLAGTLGSTTLAPGQTTTFNVTFNPSDLGTRNATLQIASNDADENPFDISLTGNGIVPPVVAAMYPFLESFETGSLDPVWIVTGTGGHRTLVTQENNPFEGDWHLTMDSNTAAGAFARNELTLTIDLLGESNVFLQFVARDFLDEDHGPPSSPFGMSGADFDGVAISADDGANWYEVQPLRSEILGTDAQFTVDLDAAIAANGLTFNSSFRIRFNHYDDTAIGNDGFAFDNIAVLPAEAEIVVEQPFGTELAHLDTIDYGDVGRGFDTIRTFTIRNQGTIPLTGITPYIVSGVGQFADYSVGALGLNSLNPGESTTFDVTVNPSALGTRAARLRITSNDPDEGTFEIDLTANSFNLITASFPFFEDFEGGSPLDPHWSITGTGNDRNLVTTANGPFAGVRHFTMESLGGSARNELTLTVNLTGQVGVILEFYAKEFSDEEHGPPATPFVGGADFDGVAISEDGVNWYEIQPLRSEISSLYTLFRVDLDFAAAQHGLTYHPGFKIRFNHYDTHPIPTDGFAFDNISVYAPPPEIVVQKMEEPTSIQTPELWASSHNNIFTIDPETGATTLVGPALAVGLAGLAYDPVNDVLYATSYFTDQLLTIDRTTGQSTVVGALNLTLESTGSGLAFDSLNERLYLVEDNVLNIVNTTTGAATPVGTGGALDLSGLAYDPVNDTLYAVNDSSERLYTVNPNTGGTTQIGTLSAGTNLGEMGLAFDPVNEILYLSDFSNQNLYQIDTETGAATLVGPLADRIQGMAMIYTPLGLAPTDLVDGASTVDFGEVSAGAVGTEVFRIRNIGAGSLRNLGVSFTGTHAAEFSVPSLGATSLGPGQVTTFDVLVNPLSTGVRTANIHFASNDDDENPFDVALTVTGGNPEIAVEQPSGTGLTHTVSTVDFGAVPPGTPVVRTFTIRNVGGTDLRDLEAAITGANAVEYTVGAISATTLTPGQSATVSVTFVSNGPGVRAAVLLIASNDADENPFEVNLSGIGSDPEIVVEQPNNIGLFDGESERDFGGLNIGQSTSKTFTVRNVGNVPLTGLAATLTGSAAAEFTPSGLATSLAGGASTTFDVSFSPTAQGLREATLEIASNDRSENPFRVDVSGTGTAPEIVVEIPNGFVAPKIYGASASGMLNEIDLGTNAVSVIGAISTQIGGLTYDPNTTTLYGVTHTTSNLISINPSNAQSTTIGALGRPTVAGSGLAIDSVNDILYQVDQTELRTIDKSTGVATLVGTGATNLHAAAFNPNTQTLYAASGADLFEINTANGQQTLIGSFGISVTLPGLAFDAATNRLYLTDSVNSQLYTINRATGAATIETTFANGLRGLALRSSSADRELVDGADLANFGDTDLGNQSVVTFQVRNTGNGPMDSLAASFSGPAAAEFSAGAFGATSLAPGQSTTFDVTFAPASLNTLQANLHIASNDSDENPFDVALQGVGGHAEIVVEEPVGVDLTDELAVLDFGAITAGQSAMKTVTIRNTGISPLSQLAITIDGPGAASYSVTSLGTTTIAPGANATFDVTFAPATFGSQAAAIRIASNDADENPFDINLLGSGQDPEIVVEQPAATGLVDGVSSKDFGSLNLGESSMLTFTVRNIGNEPLTGLATSFTGPAAADYGAGALGATTLQPAESTTFDVTFTPSALGARVATLQIASNDRDENPFDINLTGTGVSPEIVVEYAGPESSILYATSSGSLYTVDPTSGALSLIGATGGDIEGLGYDPNTDTLYGSEANNDELVTLNQSTGALTQVGPFNTPFGNGGLAFDPVGNVLYLTTSSQAIRTVNTSTGQATFVGSGANIGLQGIAFDPQNDLIFGISSSSDAIYRINKATAVQTLISSTGLDIQQAGLAYDYNHRILYFYDSLSDRLHTMDLETGQVTAVGQVNAGINIQGLTFKPAIQGTALTAGADTINYGQQILGQPLAKDFFVRNTGGGALTLTPSIVGSADFAITTTGAGTLNPGESTKVTVTLTPSSTGVQNATLRFTNNDSDENPFDVGLTGEGVAPDIIVEIEGVEVNDGATHVLPDLVGANSTNFAISVRNNGNARLSGLSASLDGPNVADFFASAFSTTFIDPGQTATFTLNFSTPILGDRTANLHIASNDPDENPFDVTLNIAHLQPTTLESFATSFGLTGDDALPTADGDGDSVSLLEEYAYGLDPTVADAQVMTAGGSSGLPLIRLVNNRLQIEFVRRRADPNLIYTPQFGNDLDETPPDGFADPVETETTTVIDAFFRRTIVNDSVGPDTNPKRFGRVRLTYPSP